MKQKRYLGFYGSDDEVLHHFCFTGEDLPNSRFHRNINFGSWAYGKSPNKTMQCITAKFFRSRDLINESTEAEGTMGCTAGLGKTTSTGKDGAKAIDELGLGGRGGEHIAVVENTPARHNMVVCTLCSCYPWPVLGLPPVWYKSAPYRSRAVIDPRGVLKDFGVTLSPEVEIRVWDSTSEMRYLVLPMRPAGTDGWSEEKLAGLVTRDSMIGVGLPLSPGTQA